MPFYKLLRSSFPITIGKRKQYIYSKNENVSDLVKAVEDESKVDVLIYKVGDYVAADWFIGKMKNLVK